MAKIDAVSTQNIQGFIDNKVLAAMLAANHSEVMSDEKPLHMEQLATLNAAMNDNYVSNHQSQQRNIEQGGPTLAV